MIEKADTAIAAAAIVAAGPLLGDYIVIILFGILGALASLKRRSPEDADGTPRTLMDAASFIAGTVGLSLAGAWLVATAISAAYPTFTANELLGAVSFSIAMFSRQITIAAPALVKKLWPWGKN